MLLYVGAIKVVIVGIEGLRTYLGDGAKKSKRLDLMTAFSIMKNRLVVYIF